MKITYKKNLHHNYLVISADQENTDESYCVKMLRENTIGGIIKPEHRIIDGQVHYYFDITSKQSLDTIHAKATINYDKIKKLFLDLLDTISRSYEYLLDENDLFIYPEHIYIDLSSGQVYICYLPGYNKDLGKQIIELVEYIMNKIDYKDKGAVLYVYNIYSICKEDGISFNTLSEVVRRDKQEGPIKNDTKKKTSLANNKLDLSEPIIKEQSPIKQNPLNQVPIMMEKILDDKEQSYYPLKTYIYTGLCILSFIIILVSSFSTKIIYNSLGNRIDYGKLFALLLILTCVIGYIMKKIWDKNKRLTKIVSREEYVDPRYEEMKQNGNIKKHNISNDKSMDKSIDILIDKPIDKIRSSRINRSLTDRTNESWETKEYIAQTTLLNGNTYNMESCLEPERDDVYEPIQINDFPFIIGKQKDNVDYCLNKEVVSRYHVKITKDKDKYYITDLNSTNGTYLNEMALSCYQRHEMQEGDKVDIAGIKYIFKVHETVKNSYTEAI